MYVCCTDFSYKRHDFVVDAAVRIIEVTELFVKIYLLFFF